MLGTISDRYSAISAYTAQQPKIASPFKQYQANQKTQPDQSAERLAESAPNTQQPTDNGIRADAFMAAWAAQEKDETAKDTGETAKGTDDAAQTAPDKEPRPPATTEVSVRSGQLEGNRSIGYLFRDAAGSGYGHMYADSSAASDQRIVYVEISSGGETTAYRIDIDAIDPENATELEMRAKNYYENMAFVQIGNHFVDFGTAFAQLEGYQKALAAANIGLGEDMAHSVSDSSMAEIATVHKDYVEATEKLIEKYREAMEELQDSEWQEVLRKRLAAHESRLESMRRPSSPDGKQDNSGSIAKNTDTPTVDNAAE